MNNREADRNPHPPACNCAECCAARTGSPIRDHRPLDDRNLSNRGKSRVPPAFSKNTDPEIVIPRELFKPESVNPNTNKKVVEEKLAMLYKQTHSPGLLIKKLFVNLFVLTTLGLFIWSMVNAFGHKWDPGVGFVTVVVMLLAFIISCTLYNKQKYRAPSMTVTVWCLVGLLLIATFSGVEPFNGYKNTLFESVKDAWQKSQQQPESNQTTQATPKPSPAPTTPSPVTVTPPVFPTNAPIIENPLETIKKLFTVDTGTDNFATMFNQYRESNNLAPLVFKDDLNKVAALRLEEIKIIFSHSSLGGYNKNLAENIVMSTGTLSNTEALAEWKNSPGHNENMLDPTYKFTGYAAGGGYAVQLFTDLATINGVPQLPPGWYWGN